MIRHYNIFNSLIWIFLIYVIGDIVTTYLALPYGSEGNPIISWILTTIGFGGLFVLKIACMVVFYYMGTNIIKAGYLNYWRFGATLIIFMGIVIIINNLNIYFKGIRMI